MDKTDFVNHPPHYANGCCIECIDCLEMIFTREQIAAYYLGNAFKYLWRWKNKGGMEDVAKAEWYLERYDIRCGSGQSSDTRLNDVSRKMRHLIENIDLSDKSAPLPF